MKNVILLTLAAATAGATDIEKGGYNAVHREGVGSRTSHNLKNISAKSFDKGGASAAKSFDKGGASNVAIIDKLGPGVPGPTFTIDRVFSAHECWVKNPQTLPNYYYYWYD